MGIRDGQYFTLPARELAAWIEQQGGDTWWTVDGDPVLSSRLSFPCPGDELAEELRKLDRDLLVQDTRKRPDANGQNVDRTALDGLVDHLGQHASVPTGTRFPWAKDRLLSLCWRDSTEEWLLVEDRETTESSQKDLAAKGRE